MAPVSRRGVTLAHRSEASAARRSVLAAAVPPPASPAQPGEGGDQGQGQQEPRRDDTLEPDELGQASAEDKALGRQAGRPGEIPPRGWLAVLRRVTREAISDEAGTAAASCGFYALLALFPAISVAISLYGLVADPITVNDQLEGARDVLPASTYDLIAARVHELAAAGRTKLSWGLALSLLVALWSAMSGTKAIISALNVAYEEREKRSLLRLNLVALLFTLGGMVGVVLALTVIVVVPTALAFSLARAARLGCGPGLLVRPVAGLRHAGPGLPLPLRTLARGRQVALGHAGLAAGGSTLARGLARLLVLRQQLRLL